jgi:hypothetical protein
MLLIVAQTIPILLGRGSANELDVDGVARVGKTRVTLDTIVAAFNTRRNCRRNRLSISGSKIIRCL